MDNLRIPLTPEICEFTGALIGDGNLWTKRSRYRIELTGDPKLDLEYYDYLTKIILNTFKSKPQKLKVHWGGLRFRLTSKPAFIFFTHLGLPCGKGKAATVKIPDKIIKKGWKYTKCAIRGIFDTDGTVFFSKKTYAEAVYPTIKISTSSRPLAMQLESLLVKHGFRAHLRKYKRDNPNYLAEYHIALYGKEMLNLWFKEIGSSNGRHYNRFINHKNVYKHDNPINLHYAAIAQRESDRLKQPTVSSVVSRHR